jgi:hypothetical protein
VTAFLGGRVSRSVAWRLAAEVLPSVLAVATVVGLFYYGEAGRAAPHLILVVAAALTVVSLVMAWVSAGTSPNGVFRGCARVWSGPTRADRRV